MVWDSQGAVSVVEAEAKKAFSNSTSSELPATSTSISLSSRSPFPLVFLLLLTYLKMPFLLPLTSPARCNSKLALAFLFAFLQSLTSFLYSSQAARPFFSTFHGCSSSLCVYSCMSPVTFPDFSLLEMHQSWPWKKRYLSVNYFSWPPLLSKTAAHGVPLRKSLERSKF